MNVRIAILLIYLLFFFDAITTVGFNMSWPFWRFSLVFRSITEAYIFLVFFHVKAVRYSFLLFFLALLFYTVGFVLLSLNVKDLSFIDGFSQVNKYFFVFFLGNFFITYEHDSVFIRNMEKAIVVFFLVNNAAILLGFTFNITMFASYLYDRTNASADDIIRFGYKGFINAQNETTGIYFFGLAYFFRRYFRYGNKHLFMLLFTVVASLLTGTKGCWGSLLLISGYYVLRYGRAKFVYPLLAIVIGSLSFLVISNWDYIWEKYLFGFQYILTREEINWVSFLTSGRDEIVGIAFRYIQENWTPLNYFFGGSDNIHLSTETDFLDGYFLIGASFLVFIIYYFSIIFYKERSGESLFLMLLMILISATGGHLISSSIVPIFYLIFVFTSRNLKSKEQPLAG